MTSSNYSVNMIDNGRFLIDPLNVKYSSDGRTLVSAPKDLVCYRVIDGTDVIGVEAFRDSNVKKIILPDTVTTIEHDAFTRCKNLQSINLPNSIREISYDAFYECVSLSEVKLPKYLDTIRSHTFRGCSSLERVYIPSSVENIDSNAFTDCLSLRSVLIPIMAGIDSNAFSGCSALSEVGFPIFSNYIGDEVLEGCVSLKKVNYPYKCIPTRMFAACDSLEVLQISGVLEMVEDDAFYFCNSLRQVEFIVPPHSEFKRFENFLKFNEAHIEFVLPEGKENQFAHLFEFASKEPRVSIKSRERPGLLFWKSVYGAAFDPAEAESWSQQYNLNIEKTD